MKTSSLSQKEFDPYYKIYINKLAPELDLRKGYAEGKKNVIQFFSNIPEDKLLYKYDEGKWSIKEILQHLIDTERIFMYRCFRIARNDKTALTGFDQDIYIEPSGADHKPLQALIEEYSILRDAFISFLNSVPDSQLEYVGNANGGALSARSAAFIMLGHEIWHMDIIKERYL
ncbi:DinB family protein [Aquimarina addita]|uniref:DinB family protein n=1 Tax=Aquimarina addita TaxID=870485 RepID=A0ABP6UNC9_9FLAO